MNRSLLLSVLIVAGSGLTFAAEISRILSVDPTAATTSPGTKVAIAGEGFLPDSKVYFDGLLARETTFVNSRRLEAITPYLRPGQHVVYVKIGEGVLKASTPFTAVACPDDSGIDEALSLAKPGEVAEALELLEIIARESSDRQVSSYPSYEKARLCYAVGDWLGWRANVSTIYPNARDPGMRSVQTYWRYSLEYSQARYHVTLQSDPLWDAADDPGSDIWFHDWDV